MSDIERCGWLFILPRLKICLSQSQTPSNTRFYFSFWDQMSSFWCWIDLLNYTESYQLFLVYGAPIFNEFFFCQQSIYIGVCYNYTCINPCAHCQITGMKSLLITVLISCSCHFNYHYYWTSKWWFDGWKW